MLWRKVFSMMMTVMLAITLSPADAVASETPRVFENQTESAEPPADAPSTEKPTKEGNTEKSTEEASETPTANETVKEQEKTPSEKELEQSAKKSVKKNKTGQAHLEVRHQQIADNGSVIFYAHLTDAEQASGTWTFVFNEEEKVRQNEKTSAQAKFYDLPEGYQAGDRYDVTVRYQGTVDGKTVEEEITYTFTLVLLKAEVSCTKNGVDYKAELAGAANAQGNWTFILIGEETLTIHDTGRVTGTVKEHTMTTKADDQSAERGGLWTRHL